MTSNANPNQQPDPVYVAFQCNIYIFFLTDLKLEEECELQHFLKALINILIRKIVLSHHFHENLVFVQKEELFDKNYCGFGLLDGR